MSFAPLAFHARFMVTLVAVDRPEAEAAWAQAHEDFIKAQVPGQHVALRLAPEGHSTKIEQVRELIQLCASTPPQGTHQWVWLASAETLTPEAGNALLKLLEEPVPGIWFLLTSSRPDHVLPTLRSRSVVLKAPHKVTDPQVPEAFPWRPDLPLSDALMLTKVLAESPAETESFLGAYLQFLRCALYRLGQDSDGLAPLIARMDQVLGLQAQLTRPIQLRLALEALLLGKTDC